ncbi:Di-copper centre-containing protein, partial [Glonium stellatum]
MSEEQMYLYLEGLAKFQSTPMTEPKSYFQIAGIHGLPYTTWPNFSWNKDIPKVSGQSALGFCTHTSILFLTWHRPYLALFEATLYKHVNDIANGINAPSAEKAKYIAAAKDFRMPYWDWARKDVPIFPREALNNENSTNGPPSSASIHAKYNPLFQAPFQSSVPPGIARGYPTTVRYPRERDPQTTLNTVLARFYKEPGKFINATLIPERNLTERVAYILLAYQRYGSMSNNVFRSANNDDKTNRAGTWGSVEDIHNAVHGLTGGGGHMSDPQVAAFDPIFWLHHTNIDRLFSIWQALHEDDKKEETYVTKQTSYDGSYTVRAGDDESIDTPLYPFRDTVTSWYTSKSVKRTETFGYTYPETAGLQYPTSGPAKDALVKTIGDYYTPLPNMIRQSRKGNKNAGIELIPQAQLLKEITNKKVTANTSEMMTLVSKMPDTQTLIQNSVGPSKPFIRDLAPDNKYLEWLVNLKAEKHALDGTFTVHIFLGPVEEENVYLWPASPNHVGTFATFGQSQDTGCGKCQQDQRDHTQVTGQIPLTLALVERYLAGILPDLGEDSVVPYLTQNLHWRVATGDGNIVDNRSNVDHLTVFVVSNEVTVPENEAQLPIYAPDVKIYPEITTNMNGGGRGEGTG